MSQKIRAEVSLGQNIRKFRKRKKLTQEQVVAKMQLMGLDITRSIFSQIECGTYNIRVAELIALKEILDINYEDFFNNISLPISKTPYSFTQDSNPLKSSHSHTN